MSVDKTKPKDGLVHVLEFIAELDRRKVHYGLASYRRDALMITVAVPGERWEIEFMTNGEVQVERFRSDGEITDERSFQELWRDFAPEQEV